MKAIIVKNQQNEIVDTFNMSDVPAKYAEKKAAMLRFKYLKLGYTVQVIY
jgi:hypothetical protein